MPAESIARNLAFMNWTVLAGLAVGSFLAVVVGRFRTAATRGFLGFTSACAGVFALVAFVSDSGLPAPADAHALTDPTWVTARRALLLVLACLAFAYVVAIARNCRAAPLAGAACLAGTGALVVAAVTWAGGFPEAGPFALQLVVLAAATGGVFAAMVLGHWYLVTPRLPNEPLVLFSRLLVGLVALQLLLFVTWMATGAGGTARRSSRWSANGPCSCGSGC